MTTLNIETVSENKNETLITPTVTSTTVSNDELNQNTIENNILKFVGKKRKQACTQNIESNQTRSKRKSTIKLDTTDHQKNMKLYLESKKLSCVKTPETSVATSLKNDIKNNETVFILEVKEQEFRYNSMRIYEWLIGPKEWLTNGHIDAYQNLIYGKYRREGFEGFIHPSKFEPMTRDFVLNPVTIHEQPFVTILNAGMNHWITITNYNPHYEYKNNTGLGLWFVYDSLNNVEFYLNTMKPALKRLNEDKNRVVIFACDMHKQFGTDDCGLFALAYALSICMEKNPAKLIFQQISMRSHFNQVLKTGTLEQFEYFEIQDNTLTPYKEYCIDISNEKLNFF